MKKRLLTLIAGLVIVRLWRSNKRAARPKDGGFLAAMGDDHYWAAHPAPRRHLASVFAPYQEEENKL